MTHNMETEDFSSLVPRLELAQAGVSPVAARGSVVLFCGAKQWRGRIQVVLRPCQFFEARHEARKILGLHIVCHLRFYLPL